MARVPSPPASPPLPRAPLSRSLVPRSLARFAPGRSFGAPTARGRRYAPLRAGPLPALPFLRAAVVPPSGLGVRGFSLSLLGVCRGCFGWLLRVSVVAGAVLSVGSACRAWRASVRSRVRCGLCAGGGFVCPFCRWSSCARVLRGVFRRGRACSRGAVGRVRAGRCAFGRAARVCGLRRWAVSGAGRSFSRPVPLLLRRRVRLLGVSGARGGVRPARGRVLVRAWSRCAPRVLGRLASARVACAPGRAFVHTHQKLTQHLRQLYG